MNPVATAGSPTDLGRTLDGWTPVCRSEVLVPDRGVCALVDGHAVAVFRCSFGAGLYAIGNVDPFTGASVLSRGLVGSTRAPDGSSVPFVSSPLRKQRISLETGAALDDPGQSVSTWSIREVDGVVEVGPPVTGPRTPTIIPGQ